MLFKKISLMIENTISSSEKKEKMTLFYYTKPLNIIHGSCYKKKIRKVIFLWFCISAWKQWSDIIFFMKKTKMHTLQVKGENFEKK